MATEESAVLAVDAPNVTIRRHADRNAVVAATTDARLLVITRRTTRASLAPIQRPIAAGMTTTAMEAGQALVRVGEVPVVRPAAVGYGMIAARWVARRLALAARCAATSSAALMGLASMAAPMMTMPRQRRRPRRWPCLGLE